MHKYQDYRFPLSRRETLISAGGANEDLTIGPVPSGHLWVSTHLAVEDEDNAFTSIRLSLTGFGEDLHVLEKVTVGAGALRSWSDNIYVPEGRSLRFRFVGTTSGDKLTVCVLGFDLIQPVGAKHA